MCLQSMCNAMKSGRAATARKRTYVDELVRLFGVGSGAVDCGGHFLKKRPQLVAGFESEEPDVAPLGCQEPLTFKLAFGIYVDKGLPFVWIGYSVVDGDPARPVGRYIVGPVRVSAL